MFLAVNHKSVLKNSCFFTRVNTSAEIGQKVVRAHSYSDRVSLTKGTDMEDKLVQRILDNPKYQQLKRKRSSFGWWLTAAMMIVYYGFILLVAFNKEFLSQRLGEGVMTVGIPIGFGVILFTIVITAIYVRRANSEFDELSNAIITEVHQ